MSIFQKRIDSKIRIAELEEVFKDSIELFSTKNTRLTINEVVTVMLKMISETNEQDNKNDMIK